LAPHSPATDQIDTLLWIGLIAAAIAVVAINAALFYAVRKYRRARGDEPRQVSGAGRVQFRVGAMLTLFAAVLFVLGVYFTDKAREQPSTGDAGLASAKEDGPLEIEATGQQWLWRYDYPNGAFSYYKVVVPSNTAVTLDLLTTDVIHTWNVPELAPKRDAVPGKTSTVTFSTADEGSYTGRAATLSGQAYAAMGTEVEVVSPQEYEDYVEQLKRDIETAQDRVVSQIENGEVP
jgi:cytochrome c oxidase subunit 2